MTTAIFAVEPVRHYHSNMTALNQFYEWPRTRMHDRYLHVRLFARFLRLHFATAPRYRAGRRIHGRSAAPVARTLSHIPVIMPRQLKLGVCAEPPLRMAAGIEVMWVDLDL